MEHTCPAKQNARPHSLRRIITLALAILSALTLLLMGLCLWFVRQQNRDRLTGTANAYLQLLAGTLENQLGTTEAYITNEIMNGEEVHRLGFAATRTQAYLDGYRVRSGFSGVLAAGGGLTAMYLYSEPNDLLMSEYSAVRIGRPNEGDVQRTALDAFVRSAAQQGTLADGGWAACRVDGRAYWVRAAHYYGVWLAAAVDLDAQANQSGGDGLLAFSTRAGELLAGSRPDAGAAGQYIALQRPLGELVIEYYAPLPAGGGLMLVLLLGVALLALAAFALVTRYLHRNVIRPAEGLVDAMQRIAGGDLTARVNGDGGSRELQQVKGAFNAMLEQIETLKIEQYEKTLEAERYELAALKMQIRPHFFLNTLKLLYAMAETGDTRQIQELILLLAKHLRAVLDYNKKTTTLREEAELCQNYIELSSVGQQGERACCYAEIERGLAELPLPPLALLSLVENSVKYAQQADRPLTVHITARALPLETGRLVHIRLRDNGPGFAPEQLQALNREGESPAGHFGLHNIRRQCALMYGPDFAMTFTNAPDGGAVVEMYIPQPGAQGKETNA